MATRQTPSPPGLSLQCGRALGRVIQTTLDADMLQVVSLKVQEEKSCYLVLPAPMNCVGHILIRVSEFIV